MAWILDLNVFLFAFWVCLCLVLALSFLAKRVGLVDEPSGRKRHAAPTPLVGGICVFAAFAATVYFIPGASISWSLIGWLSLVLIIGVVDDYADISHRIRLLVHALIVVGIAITEGLYVSDVGAITGGAGAYTAPYAAAVAFTVVGVLGAINAVNMGDGVDGLLGSLVTISLLAVLILTSQHNLVGLFSRFEMLALVGAMIGFLVFNSRLFFERARVFFGDAGSTTVGFLLVYILISTTQGSNQVFSPVLAGWIVGLPLLDASAVIAIRVLKGKSPFSADRTHLHHILLDKGVSVNRTVAVLVSTHVGMIGLAVAISLSGYPLADAVLFWSFVGLVVCRIIAATLAPRESEVVAKNETTQTKSSVTAGIGISNTAGARRVTRMEGEASEAESSGAA